MAGYYAVVFLHVVFGFVWAGGGMVSGFYLIPSVVEAGPAGGAVMAGLARRRFPLVMNAAALIAVVTGLYLVHQNASASWMASPEGIVLSVGALLALGAFGMGSFIQRPTAMRMGALAARLQAAGRPPTPEEGAELRALGARLVRVGRVTGWHLLAVVVLMAAHRLAAHLG